MKLLLAIDGSEGALEAVRYALQLRAQGLHAEYVLVNVQEPPSLYEMAVAHDAERLKSLRTAAGADLLSLPESLLDGARVGYESEVAGGEPVNVLLEVAENYGCVGLLIGARGMGSPGAAGLGSVARGLCERSAMPVIVVPMPPGDD